MMDEASRVAAEASLPFVMEAQVSCKLCGFAAKEPMLQVVSEGVSGVTAAIVSHMAQRHPEINPRDVTLALLHLMSSSRTPPHQPPNRPPNPRQQP